MLEISKKDIVARLQFDNPWWEQGCAGTIEYENTPRRKYFEPFYQGILDVSDEPLVSRDYVGNSHSGTVDLLLTNVVAGDLAKVVVWYDNEWGYSNRLVEMVADVGKALQK